MSTTPRDQPLVENIPFDRFGAFIKSKEVVLIRLQYGLASTFIPEIAQHFKNKLQDACCCGYLDKFKITSFDVWAQKYFAELAERGVGYYLFVLGKAVAFHPEQVATPEEEKKVNLILGVGGVVLSFLTWNPAPVLLAGIGISTTSKQKVTESVVALFEQVLSKASRAKEQNGGANFERQPEQPKSISEYYAILEVGPSATDEELKAAYLEKITGSHPDKVAHLSKKFQQFAAEQTIEIKKAYEEIRTWRADKSR